ncbi:hypothetical protein F4859DRAFT_469347 [Xylaria cf. heliscus]|nr:hypothetical protein F4859DRAFT_469347 [Xylaria cf. heliscus]
MPFIIVLFELAAMAISLGAMQVVIVSTIAFVLSITALGLRLWSRHILRARLQFNDYMIIIASIFNAGAYANALAACFVGGLGVHLLDVLATHPQYYANYLKIFISGELLWCTANTFVKLSILSLYQILFPPKIFIRVCRGMMLLTAAYWTMVFLESFILCKPVQYTWDKSIPNGTCYNERIAYLVAAIVNLIIDAIIVVLPMPLLFRLQLTLPKRLGVVAMFSLGGLICVISLLRVIWVSNWNLSDLTFGVVNVTIYTILEPFLGVVNACLPVIKPALIRMFGPGAQIRSIRKYATWKTTNTSVTQERGLPPSHRANFDQLHDEIPLTRIHATNSPVQITDTEEYNSITITRGWKVDSRSDQELRIP